MPLTLKIYIQTGGETTFAGERVLDGECVTIGRSKDCTLSLEDPDKYLSRVQAELFMRDDGYLLKSTSKHSPVLLNGQALGIDTEVTVHAGDTLTMDVYDLEIVSTGAPEGDPDATTIVPEADPEATMIFGGLPRSPRAFQTGVGARATEAGARAPKEPGTVQVLLERYRLEATLVLTGKGTIYRAHDLLQSRDVLLRMMPPALLGSEPNRQRFVQESQAAIKLAHPHIATTHDVHADDEQAFLTMELLPGQTLRAAMDERIRTGRQWSEAEAVMLMRPLCEALAYAHQFTVHQDVRPENVWLGDAGSVKLMDFGFAPASLEGQVTSPAQVSGSPSCYLAPEQTAGAAKVDHRADQYSLGVILYELLAGSIPTERINSLGALRKDVSRTVLAAIERALSINPVERFGSDAQFLAALHAPPTKQFAPPAKSAGEQASAGTRRLKRFGVGAVVLGGLVALLLQFPMLKGILPAGEVYKQEEQNIARLEGEAKALLKMVETDQRELKEAVVNANREVERIAGQFRSARTSTERAGLELAQREARNTAKQLSELENKLRDQAEGPQGLPKAEGNLSAATTAAKGADHAKAIRLLEEAVNSLTRMRAGISEDRKAAQAAQHRRQDELRIAETQAIKAEEARIKAEAEARARSILAARARAEADARAKAAAETAAKVEADARARTESEARPR